MSNPAALYDAIQSEIGNVLIGNRDVVEGLTISLLTKGHLLIEGVPGTAKTTTANLFARVSGLDFRRIQMTPDILPADITGTEVYREQRGEFEIHRGPVFANLVVADEINRGTPKAQSALLEAMQERHVTIGGQTLTLADPFMVVATQNPIEMEGTYELPEAQRDRFQLKYKMDLLEREDEREFLNRFHDNPGLGPETVERVVDVDDLIEAREAVTKVFVSDAVREFLLDIVTATRNSPDIEHGASTRASLSLLTASKARAAIHGRNYVLPDDVLTLVGPALTHRLVLSSDAQLSDRDVDEIIEEILEEVDTPEAKSPASSPE
ncbi:ATPase associated with various cellular activities AAA_3 [Halogeometricum pallidum JCM 14848]|uniref:ATPase associated with various cellular activities AAA_3 n=1 Tax=Halogeometricum pallidum JCM 14848 TaxID=1227487 RepID=M0D9E2_HALPD|nr:MoxR family ATPase [Halogeometricum pallidum]ELZ31337.1 ATPase associated with various cellular activities AAA_3 [Halogeometricum pallidum JCM 14848]